MPHSGVQVRFEFVFHRSLKPWLVEVNASPNIRPTPTELHHDGMPFRGLCKSMAAWLASVTQAVRQRNHQQVLGSNVTEHAAKEMDLQPLHEAKAQGFDRSVSILAKGEEGDTEAQGIAHQFTMRSLAEHADVDCEVSTWYFWPH